MKVTVLYGSAKRVYGHIVIWLSLEMDERIRQRENFVRFCKRRQPIAGNHENGCRTAALLRGK
jgi:hypothetical protein